MESKNPSAEEFLPHNTKAKCSSDDISNWRYCSLAVTPLIANLSIGFAQGYSGVALVDLEDYFGPGVITVNVQSWIGSVLIVGLFFGTVIGGSLSEWIPKKYCNIIISPCIVLGWVLMASTTKDKIYLMYLGRLLTGFGNGFYVPISLTYMAEISSKEFRGIATSLCPLFACIGFFMVCCLGLVFNWYCLSLVSTLPPLLVMATSPLMKKTKAMNTRRRSESLDDDTRIKERKKYGFIITPTSLLIGLFIIQCFTGANIMSYYALNIIDKMTSSPTISSIGLLSLSLAFILGYALASSLLLVRFGRKKLLITSAMIMSFSMWFLAVVQHFELFNEFYSAVSSLAVIFIFIVAYSMGMGPVPYIFIGEMLPPEYQGLSSGFVTSMNMTVNFISLKAFPYMLEYMQLYGCSYFSGSICLFGAFYSWFLIPETKDLHREDIWNLFGRPVTRSVSST